MGFLPSGAVALWGILAPLGALVFLEVREAIRWFAAFVVVFALTGIAGEVLFPDADLPVWFTSTMLALNVIGAGAVAFTLLASFARERNAALTALLVEQQKPEALLVNIPPRSIAERLKASQTIADHFASMSIIFADVVGFTPLSERLPAEEVLGILDQLFSRFERACRAPWLGEDQDEWGLLHGRGRCARPAPRSRPQGGAAGARHARRCRDVGSGRRV